MAITTASTTITAAPHLLPPANIQLWLQWTLHQKSHTESYRNLPKAKTLRQAFQLLQVCNSQGSKQGLPGTSLKIIHAVHVGWGGLHRARGNFSLPAGCFLVILEIPELSYNLKLWQYDVWWNVLKWGKKTDSCGWVALSVLLQVLYRVEVNKATDMKKVLLLFTEPRVIWL